jgi:hypothetical protein
VPVRHECEDRAVLMILARWAMWPCSHLGLDIKLARLVSGLACYGWLYKRARRLARLVSELELARLSRKPNHKNTVQRDYKFIKAIEQQIHHMYT